LFQVSTQPGMLTRISAKGGQRTLCHDVTLYLYHTIISKYGWGYMTRLMVNEPQFVRRHLGVAQAVASSKATISFDATVL
jgi:hypothetical protein